MALSRYARSAAAVRRVTDAPPCIRRPISPHHPQIRQGKQRDQLRGVLGQATETHLGVAELALDHPEKVFDLGAYMAIQIKAVALISSVLHWGAWGAFRADVMWLQPIGP